MNEKVYKVVDGIHYHIKTPDAVIEVLERARKSGQRLHISFGDVKTGRDWLEEFESYGYMGQSTGRVKIPLLVHNRRSYGGGHLLDHCIVRIRTSTGGHVLWQHKKYHHGLIAIRPRLEPLVLPDGRSLTVDVLRDGETQASFENITKARKWVQKMGLSPCPAPTRPNTPSMSLA